MLCVILLIHSWMNLFIAKESALIYADEVLTRSLSQLLDLKRQGVDGSNYLKTQHHSNIEVTDNGNNVQPESTQIYRMTYMKLDKKIYNKVSQMVYCSVVIVALLNTENYLALVGLWGVVGSIVCPLIVSVLPGGFFYYVLKEQEVESKGMKAAGIAYCVFGLVILPVFLTLSTKNLFSSTGGDQDTTVAL